MKKNKNIDIIRALALLFVIIYHLSVVLNFQFSGSLSFINNIMNFGGEIGVTLFFIISGYGIYCSIENQIIEDKKFDFFKFIKKRLCKIYPEYIVCLIISLLLTSSAIYLCKTQIVTHLLFIHNWFPDTHGGINGVLWTMGVIFQFYVIAYLLYKCLKKHPYITSFITILFTVFFKYVTYHFILANMNYESIYYFIYGRQLFTCIDNFAIGMLLAYTSKKYLNIKFKWFKIFVCLILLYGFLTVANARNIYTDSNFGYLFHTFLALILGTFMFVFARIKINYKNILSKVLLFLSKYEYSIYIWHLLIFNNLLKNSSWVSLLSTSKKAAILLIVSIMFGYMFSHLINSINLNELFVFFENNKRKIVNTFFIVLALIGIFFAFPYLKDIYNDLIIINNNKIQCYDTLSSAINEVNDIIPNEKYTYLYIDNTDYEGYMNYYRTRYYFAPNVSIMPYNDYISVVHSGTTEDIIDMLNNTNVDYVFVKYWVFLDDYLVKKPDVDILVYKKNNKQGDSLKDILIPLNGGVLK